MAPTKSSKSKGKPSGGAKKSAKPTGPTSGGISKRKQKQMSLAKPGGAQKSKSTQQAKKKKRVYTEKELDIPKLNGIVPAGIAKPKGQKKGKVFVDDPESMMTIMAIVNADKEGQIESKMMKARQMEEIREARRKEQEARSDQKKAKLEETKDSLRKKRNKRISTSNIEDTENESPKPAKSKKRVSFG